MQLLKTLTEYCNLKDVPLSLVKLIRNHVPSLEVSWLNAGPKRSSLV